MNGFYGGAFRKVGDAECATAASPELGQAEFSPKSTQAAATASRGHSGAVEGTPRPRTTARSRLHAAGRRPPAAAAMPPAADSAEAAAAHRQRKPAVHQPPAGRGKPATAAAGQGRSSAWWVGGGEHGRSPDPGGRWPSSARREAGEGASMRPGRRTGSDAPPPRRVQETAPAARAREPRTDPVQPDPAMGSPDRSPATPDPARRGQPARRRP